jgi:hypothetical protein
VLAVGCLSPLGAAAQTTTWTGPGVDLNVGANWSAGVPDGSTTAIFGATGPSSLVTSGAFAARGIQLNTGPTYTFAISSPVSIGNGGIVASPSGGGLFSVPAGGTLSIAGSVVAPGSAVVSGNTVVATSQVLIDNQGTLTFSSGTVGSSFH